MKGIIFCLTFFLLGWSLAAQPLTIDQAWQIDFFSPNNIGQMNQVPSKNYVYYLDAFYTEGLIRFAKDGYMGLMDESGKIVLPAIYDNIFSFNSKMARYVKQDVRGIVEFGEKNIFPDDCYIEEFHDGVAKFSFPLKDKQEIGFITETGTIIAEPGKANGYTNFIGGIAMRQEGIGWLILMDKTGIEYRVARSGHIRGNNQRRTEGYVCVPLILEGKQMYYFVDQKGQKLNTSYYEQADNFVNGFAPAHRNGKWMILDTNGIELETEYVSLSVSENGLFTAMKKNGKCGLVNGYNQIVVPFEYGKLNYLFSSLYSARKGTGFSTPIEFTGGFFVINTMNEVIVSIPEYDADKVLDWQNYYQIDKIGNTGLGICFFAENVINTDEGLILSRFPIIAAEGLNYYFDETGLISNTGYPSNRDTRNIVKPDVIVMDLVKSSSNWREKFYNTEQPFTSEFKLSAVKKNGRIELIDFSLYKAFLPVGNGEFIVAKDNNQNNIKYGVVNFDKKELISFDFDELKPIALKIYAGRKGDKWFLLYSDSKNDISSKFYDELIPNPCGVIAMKNNQYGFLDFTGKVVIPFQNIVISQNLPNGTLYVYEHGKKVILTKSN